MGIYDSWLYRFLTDTLNSVAWLYILLPCVFVGGIYMTVGSGAVQFRRFGYAMKNTAGKIFRRQEAGRGSVTPLQAVTTALAATVGTGNIVGTAQAIAMGGYGAVFWLWVAALLGMVIKYAEAVIGGDHAVKVCQSSVVGSACPVAGKNKQDATIAQGDEGSFAVAIVVSGGNQIPDDSAKHIFSSNPIVDSVPILSQTGGRCNEKSLTSSTNWAIIVPRNL